MAAPCEDSGAERIRSGLKNLPVVDPLRARLREHAPGEAWLVGGFLRDLALGKSPLPWDLDLALPASAEVVARELARTFEGSAFALDEEQGAWRVALPDGNRFDVIEFRARDIAGDLRGRDFTVNSLAFDLFGDRGLFDPLGGLRHLAEARLVPSSPSALTSDPARVLRAYRFSFGLGLRMDGALLDALPAGAALLGRVAPERIRTELFATLALPNGSAALRAMAEHGTLEALFPEVGAWRGFDQGTYHAHDLLEHSLRAVEAAERLAASGEFPAWVEDHLAREFEPGLSRLALLKFAALFHDVAKPETLTLDGSRRRFLSHDVRGGHQIRKLLEGLRVGRRARTGAQRLVAAHLRLFSLANQAPPTRTARLRYLRDLEADVPEAVLLALADELATGPNPPSLVPLRRTARELLELYEEQRAKGRPEPLVRGRDLRAELGLPEGPEIGDLLRQIAEAEARGEVRSRAEALDLARRLRSKEDRKA